MSDISAPGWEGVNSHAVEVPQYSETEQAHLDKAIAKTFASASGKIVVKWLVDTYLEQPSWAPGYTTDYGFFREGQNTLIREMLMRVKRAKENG